VWGTLAPSGSAVNGRFGQIVHWVWITLWIACAPEAFALWSDSCCRWLAACSRVETCCPAGLEHFCWLCKCVSGRSRLGVDLAGRPPEEGTREPAVASIEFRPVAVRVDVRRTGRGASQCPAEEDGDGVP